jgi:hypothetical protein
MKISDDVAAEMGQFQIFLTFLSVLVYQRKLLGDGWNNADRTTLIIVNKGVIVLFVYYACTTLCKEVQRMDLTQLAVRAAEKGP